MKEDVKTKCLLGPPFLTESDESYEAAIPNATVPGAVLPSTGFIFPFPGAGSQSLEMYSCELLSSA